MYYRRKILLHLISAFGAQGVEKLKLQNLLFLFCQQQEQPAFDFVPYSYGCFSFQAHKDLSVLSDHYQLLERSEDRWFLKDAQSASTGLKHTESQIASQLLGQFVTCETSEIINYVYRRHPYFSINSVRTTDKEQEREANQQRDAIRQKDSAVLFTVGYEGKSIDAYLNELIKNNISLLCDVRNKPLSMKYGFSKKQLNQYCANLNIAYVHIPELGIVSEKRKNLTTPDSYRKLFAEYDQQLPQQAKSLVRITELLNENKRIALTCFEKNPRDCHRHCISDYLAEEKKIVCKHL